MSKPKKSRLEINVRRLLLKCEEMANKKDLDNDWRLPKFIESVDNMVRNLKNEQIKPDREELEKYSKRIDFLKGLLETRKMNDPMHKSIAMQMLAPPSTLNSTAVKDIYQKNLASCEDDLRKELLQDQFELRHRNKSEPSGSQELDSILKYHSQKHDQIATEMLIMTRSVKEQSQLAGKIIREDTKTLEKSSKIMDDNYFHLKKQNNRLQDFISKSGWQCWIWIIYDIFHENGKKKILTISSG
ncbi:hypothetical protein PGB90_004325 [Kerria lacca]